MQHAECVLKNFKWKTNKYYEINNKCYKKIYHIEIVCTCNLAEERLPRPAHQGKMEYDIPLQCSLINCDN